MKRFHAIKPVVRAIAVMAAVGVTVTGITFAALQSQSAALTGNSIETASANLQISKDNTADSFSSSTTGYDFTNVLPGGPAVPAEGNTFYLRNGGTTDLALKLSVNGTQISADTSLALSSVYIILTAPDSSTQKLALPSLFTATNPAGTDLGITLDAGTTGQFKVQVQMDSNALSGATTSSAAIKNVALSFGGTAV